MANVDLKQRTWRQAFGYRIALQVVGVQHDQVFRLKERKNLD